MDNDRKNQPLLGLADVETIKFDDNWPERLFQNPRDVVDLLIDLPAYMAFGKTTVDSRGAFEATRRGDQLQIRGMVTHGFPNSESFDFHDGQPGAWAARSLENNGEASPFRMTHDRRQEVEAVSRYEPDGALTLLCSTWGPIR